MLSKCRLGRWLSILKGLKIMLVNLSKRELQQLVDALNEQDCGLQSSEDIRLQLQEKLSSIIAACTCKEQNED